MKIKNKLIHKMLCKIGLAHKIEKIYDKKHINSYRNICKYCGKQFGCGVDLNIVIPPKTSIEIPMAIKFKEQNND